MTCIVGFTENDITWIGGDSFGSNGYSGQVYKNKKVFKMKDNKNIIAGYTTSFRMGQILQYSTNLFDELVILKNEIDTDHFRRSKTCGCTRTGWPCRTISCRSLSTRMSPNSKITKEKPPTRRNTRLASNRQALVQARQTASL